MKFVYNFANLNDVKRLYGKVKKANSKIPMKTIEEVTGSVVLGHPLAISNYLLDLNQYENIPGTLNNTFWSTDPFTPAKRIYKSSTDFVPAFTDAGLCSVYNSPMISDVFVDSSVAEFKEVFINASEQMEVKTAGIGEYSFVIDTQKRSQYPFRTVDSTHFARYTYQIVTYCKNAASFLLKYFRLALNHPDEFFNVVGNTITLEGGTEVTIRVIPEEIATDENVGPEVPIEKRNCRLKNEVPDEMKPLFKSYTRNSCMYTCMYTYA